jgi:DNA-binding response OmpR family regulator
MARAADRVRVLALGASDVLSKPLQRLELVHKIETLLALARAPSQAPAFDDAAELLGSAGPSRVLSETAFLERSNGRCASETRRSSCPPCWRWRRGAARSSTPRSRSRRVRAGKLDPSQLAWRASVAALPESEDSSRARAWKSCFDGIPSKGP